MENVFSVRPTGKFPEKVELPGLPSKQFHFFWEFSSRANRKNVFHLAPNRNFRNFWLNGKRPGIIKVETETLIILDITKTESNNCFIIHWTTTNWSHVFASSLTASNTKRANLTWLPLEIMHRGHTWHDYPWPWVSLTWWLYKLQLWGHGRWFRKFTVRFRPIRKESESWMYNNSSKQNRT